MNKREIRCGYGEQYIPRLRESTEEGAERRTIEGYAVVFDVESRVIVDWCDAFNEIIHRGAITQDTLNKCDIKMTIWHNREMLLARSNKGKGTLTLKVDNVGVFYSFDAPHTPAGDTAVELVKRGDLAGSSFAYITDENSNVRYEHREDELPLRHIDKVDYIYDVTIAADPAYVETSVNLREISNDSTEEARAREIENNKKAIASLRELARRKR